MPKIKPVKSDDREAKRRFVMRLIDWLESYGFWQDVAIYANGLKFASDRYNEDTEIIESTTRKGTIYYESRVPDPRKIVEYANPDLITMTFEGPLYNAINYDSDAEKGLAELFSRYGMYFEFGYAWSLSAYEE